MAIKYDESGMPYDDSGDYYPPANPQLTIPPGYELRNGVVSADLGRVPVPINPELDATRGPGRFITVPLAGGNVMGRYSENPDAEELMAWTIHNAKQGGRVDDATKAIQAAMQFQGMRGYQNDIASGMAPAEALARNAWSMFGARGGNGLSGIGALARAVTPQSPRMQNIHGVGYTFNNESGKWEPQTPNPPVKVPPPTKEEQTYLENITKAQDADRKAEIEFRSTPTDDPLWQEKRNGLNATARVLKNARDAYQAFLAKKGLPAVSVPTPAELISRPTYYAGPKLSFAEEDAMIKANREAKAAEAANEVIRIANGRRAVFDANTKKFIRWAD